MLRRTNTALVIWSTVVFGLFIGVTESNNDWDLLIFTQHWPVTVCLHYEENYNRLFFNQSPHVCSLPSDKDKWRIHGIWPTKLHTEGPAFCNTTLKFNITTLDPVHQDLVNNWPNIEKGKGTSSLWRHEWLKHGTCSVSLNALNDELKYFGKGLDWFGKYNITAILNDNNIRPSDSDQIHVVDVHNAVHKAVGSNPQINCIREMKTNKAYLFEIRICFNKELQVVDCNGVRRNRRSVWGADSGGEILTNCPLDETLIYPVEVPPTFFPNLSAAEDERVSYYQFLITTLRTLRFLKWMTL